MPFPSMLCSEFCVRCLSDWRVSGGVPLFYIAIVHLGSSVVFYVRLCVHVLYSSR